METQHSYDLLSFMFGGLVGAGGVCCLICAAIIREIVKDRRATRVPAE